jgi:hypothetical protein
MIFRQKKNTKVEGESRRHDRRRHGAVAARAAVVVVGGVIVMAFVALCDTR